MFAFTKQERTVLVVFTIVILCGTVLRHAFTQFLPLKDVVDFIDSERVYFRTDLNTAGVEELMELPYIGRYTAERIVDYRRQHGPFVVVEQVKNVKGIRDKNYGRFSMYLKVSRP